MTQAQATRPLTFRVTSVEEGTLRMRASAEGLTLSAYIRRALLGYAADDTGRLDDHERRLVRLEELAGL